jgi:hypothetical protein
MLPQSLETHSFRSLLCARSSQHSAASRTNRASFDKDDREKTFFSDDVHHHYYHHQRCVLSCRDLWSSLQPPSKTFDASSTQHTAYSQKSQVRYRMDPLFKEHRP